MDSPERKIQCCPKCESTRIRHRKKTHDYICYKCGWVGNGIKYRSLKTPTNGRYLKLRYCITNNHTCKNLEWLYAPGRRRKAVCTKTGKSPYHMCTCPDTVRDRGNLSANVDCIHCGFCILVSKKREGCIITCPRCKGENKLIRQVKIEIKFEKVENDDKSNS